MSWLNQTHKDWAERKDGARQRPLPFDDNLQPTPAFFAIRAAMDTARLPAQQVRAERAEATPTTAPDGDGGGLYKAFPVQGSPK